MILILACVGIITVELYPFLLAIWERWQKKRIERITPKLDRMFLDIPLKKILLIDVFSPICCGIALMIITKQMLLGGLGLVLGLIIPTIVVKILEKKRKEKFSQQLTDGLMIISGSLKAGLSLVQAFEALVEEMPSPINQEFSLVLRENLMGVSLEESLHNLKRRMPVDELDFVVTSMLVARETGGDLTEVFSQVVSTIRERNKLNNKVKVLTVQGKLQGIIMGFLPIVFGAFVLSFNKNFFQVMTSDSTGKALLIYAGVSYIIGLLFIAKFSKVEV